MGFGHVVHDGRCSEGEFGYGLGCFWVEGVGIKAWRGIVLGKGVGNIGIQCKDDLLALYKIISLKLITASLLLFLVLKI